MSENKLLLKNSVVLYARLVITTIIGLYASRVILIQLGASDFGLFTVVGGLVAIFNMLNTTMISTSNRYIAVELGKAESGNVNKTFNALLVIHMAFCVLLVLLVELVGVWYVDNQLNVSASKIADARFILHLTTINVVLSMLSIPFQGLIVAHEKFSFKAFVEVLQSVLNLLACLLLAFSDDHKLRIYAAYLTAIQVVVMLAYYAYTKCRYSLIIRWNPNRNKSEYIAISKFFGWQFVYVLGSVGSNQGGALIMNSFFGTALNAAYGIAQRVNEFVFSFVKNLNQAAVPQIMKSFSGGDEDRSLQLVYLLSKYTFFIMLIPAIPIMLCIDSILLMWLKVVPPFTSAFVVLRIVHGLVSCLESGFDANIDATGKIRNTKLIFSIIFLLLIPVTFVLYRYKFPPYTISVVYVFGELIFFGFQTSILSKLTSFSIKEYFRSTIQPVLCVLLFVLPQFFIRSLISNPYLNLLLVTGLSFVLTSTTIYFLGLTKTERNIIKIRLSRMYQERLKM